MQNSDLRFFSSSPTSYRFRRLFARTQQLLPKILLGCAVLLAIVALYFSALRAILHYGGTQDWRSAWQDPYLRHVLFFSFWQASLSALLSVGLGAIFARALFYQHFPFKHLVNKLFSVTFVLPVLVAIFGIMGIYGHNGVLAQLAHWLGVEWRWDIYGLTGILLAHLFFNIPLATRLFLQGLQRIPTAQRKLAAQLGVQGWDFIRLVELPLWCNQGIAAFVLIFMLCFTSFATVLTLGGSPKYTTLEVAIYQSIFFDFDLSQAAFFALLQFACCFGLFTLSTFFNKPQTAAPLVDDLWLAKQAKFTQLFQRGVLVLGITFIASPLLQTLLAGFFSGVFWQSWQKTELWRALGYSLLIAPSAGVLSVLGALALLYFSQNLRQIQQAKLANGILNAGMVILAIPTLVLALGLFLLLKNIETNTAWLFAVVVLCNALMALPFVIRVLSLPLQSQWAELNPLCEILGIRGLARWKVVEWPRLKAPLGYAFALASTLSLGDFTAIALFGDDSFTSLPQLLYQQLARYQMAQASVTTWVLLVLCGVTFYLVKDNAQS